jgi:hypothetical protein
MELAYSSDDSFDSYDDEYIENDGTDHRETSAKNDEVEVAHRAARQFRSRNASKREKTIFFEKNASLIQQRSNLERDLRLQFFETKIPELRSSAAHASTEARAMDASRQKESRSLSTQLSDFQMKTKRLSRQLQRIVQDQQSSSSGPTGASETSTSASASASASASETGFSLRPDEVQSLHSTFDHLESVLASFKRDGRQRYQELQRNERELTIELEEFLERSQAWDTTSDVSREVARFTTPSKQIRRSVSSSTSSSSRGGSRGGSTSNTTTRPLVILNIEKKIIELGGTTGGWDARDHATFLRLLSRYHLRMDVSSSVVSGSTAPSPGTSSSSTSIDRQRRIESMLNFSVTKLPHVDTSEVRQHWKWYMKHAALIEKKRKAVKDWRENRRTPSSSASSLSNFSPSSSSSSSSSSSFSDSEERNSIRRGKKEKRRLEEVARLGRASALKKVQLMKWREEKEVEKKMEERKQMEKKEQEIRRRKQAKENSAAKKEEIAMYRLQREAEAAHQKAVQKVLQTARGHVRGPPPSADMLRKRHERDMLKLKEQKRAKEKQEMEKKRKENKRFEITRTVNQRVRKDFNRLTRHTTASAHNALTPEKLDERFTARNRTHGGHNATLYGHTGAELSRGKTYGMSKASTLKVPTWRKAARS